MSHEAVEITPPPASPNTACAIINRSVGRAEPAGLVFKPRSNSKNSRGVFKYV